MECAVCEKEILIPPEELKFGYRDTMGSYDPDIVVAELVWKYPEGFKRAVIADPYYFHRSCFTTLITK